MSSTPFIGMPGPLEIMIILAMVLIPAIVIALVIVVVLGASRKSRRNLADNPNLFPCPDCGRFVSRQAVNCPQCGRPFTPEQQP